MRGLTTEIDPEAVSRLSARERQVLHMAASGFPDKQIGEQLNITLNTLRSYWSRIRSKLGDASRPALVGAYVSAQNMAAPLEGTVQRGWVWDIDSDTLTASDEINDLHGLERGLAHPSSDYSNLYHPEDRDKIRAVLHEMAIGEHETLHITFRLIVGESMQVVSITLVPVRDKSHRVIKVLGFRARSLDIRETAGAVRVGMYTRDLATEEFWADNEACSIYQVPLARATDRSAFVARFHPSDYSKVEQLAEDATRDGKDIAWTDHRIFLPDGTVLWAKVKLRIKLEANGHKKVFGTVMAFE
jgi:DNA-binding CsgD family transcriptional regulator